MILLLEHVAEPIRETGKKRQQHIKIIIPKPESEDPSGGKKPTTANSGKSLFPKPGRNQITPMAIWADKQYPMGMRPETVAKSERFHINLNGEGNSMESRRKDFVTNNGSKFTNNKVNRNLNPECAF